jgi:flagellin-like hook-associated protein FlgL
MGMSVNTNTAAMNAYRNLSVTNNQMSKSLERLSSGFRINRAADDAAGLAISEGLRSQIGGLTQAVRNTQDGTSVVQTAEGALNETTSILQRMRDLSVQASNDGGLNQDAKDSIQKEVSQLKSELTRISDTTTYNGTKLLDGSYDKTFQVGANSGQTIAVKIGTEMGTSGLGLSGLDVSIGQASNALAGTRTTTAAAGTAAATAAANGSAGVVTVGSASDFTASEAYDKLNGTVTVNGKSLDLSTVQYDAGDDADAKLDKLNDALTAAGVAATAANTSAGLTLTGAVPANQATTAQVAAAEVNFTAANGASQAIIDIDKAIKTVSSQRADLGAIQNRFEHTINNLNVAIENTTASESRIRDTDMASEMTNFTRTQVLTQAGTAMLSQANQSTQGILRLLG